MKLRPSPRLKSLSAEELKAFIYSDFAVFCQTMFSIVYPGKTLQWAPYLDVICSMLQNVAHGRERQLIITLPPRHLKSFITSVCLPAYILGRYPGQEIMCVSYAQELSRDFARQTEAIMRSDIYRAVFGDVLKTTRQPLHVLRTQKGGVRRATSMDGTATGVGGDIIIFDDPQKPGETLSEAVRRSTNEAYENTFASRGNDPDRVRKVIVMQRLHEDDFVAHVMGLGEKWKLINFPAIAEEDERIEYPTPGGLRVYTRKIGEALHPERVSLGALAEIRQALGAIQYATQYQQRPAPAGGGVVKIEWFKRFDFANRPEFDRIIQSWDTASTVNKTSDWSVCITLGIKGKQIFVLEVYRARLEFPELLRQVVYRARLHEATVVLVEDHNSGTSIMQQLRADGFGRCRAVKPVGDKKTRMENQTALIEAGHVFLAREEPWLEAFLHEMAVFPNGKHDDQVDAFSQALNYIQSGVRCQGWMGYMRERAEEVRGAPYPA